MKIWRILWLLYSVLFLVYNSHGQLYLNEIVSDNADVASVPMESDYIEIYNAGQTQVNLNEYYLSDDDTNLQKWQFPPIVIYPDQFLLILANGSGISSEALIDTNFKISSNGETIYLVEGSNIVDVVTVPKLYENAVYGRLPNGTGNWYILPQGSPSQTNTNVDVITISHASGYYQQSLQVTAKSVLNYTIHYTTDGNIPTQSSPILSDALELQDKSSSDNVWSNIPTTVDEALITYHDWASPPQLVDKGNVIRLASFSEDIMRSRVYTYSYFIMEDIFNRYDLPILSLVTDSKHLFDDNEGIYVPGINYSPNNPEWTGNYFLTGIEAEKPIHVEYFEHDGQLGFAQDAGLRVHGGKTRHAAQKSLRFYARSEYGRKAFEYPILPQKDHSEYKRFIVRSTMGAWNGQTIIQDVLAQLIVDDLDIELMGYRPVVTFVNGEYWGIQTIRDRIDEHYLEYTGQIDSDLIKIYDWDCPDYDALLDFVRSSIPLDDEEAQVLTSQIDIDNFIDFNIAQMFFSNRDWPANNSKHWKTTVDGKWRWILYDLDAGFGSPNKNMLMHNTSEADSDWPTGERHTVLFRGLISNNKLKSRFIKRYKELLETTFKPERMYEILNDLMQEYGDEMPRHLMRWGYPSSITKWRYDVETEIGEFFNSRPCIVKEHIESFFELDEFEFDCEPTDNSSSGFPKLVIGPNPSTNWVYIHNKSNKPITGNLQLRTLIGDVVIGPTPIYIEAEDHTTFQFPITVDGVYLVSLIIDEEIQTYKIAIADSVP